MRRIEQNLEQIDAAGADVLVLSADAPEVLRGLEPALPIASGSDELWAELGIANPDRPGLPHPTTFIVGTDGKILFQDTHPDYRQRTSIPDMLAALSAGEGSPPPGEAAGVDWGSGVALAFSGADDCLALEIRVAEGFHLYGQKEEIGRPLQVSVDQVPGWPLLSPGGSPKALPGLGVTSWVIEGMSTIEWTVPSGEVPRELTGTVSYQLCTESACSAPQSSTWAVTRGDGPCSTPDQMDF